MSNQGAFMTTKSFRFSIIRTCILVLFLLAYNFYTLYEHKADWLTSTRAAYNNARSYIEKPSPHKREIPHDNMMIMAGSSSFNIGCHFADRETGKRVAVSVQQILRESGFRNTTICQKQGKNGLIFGTRDGNSHIGLMKSGINIPIGALVDLVKHNSKDSKVILYIPKYAFASLPVKPIMNNEYMMLFELDNIAPNTVLSTKHANLSTQIVLTVCALIAAIVLGAKGISRMLMITESEDFTQPGSSEMFRNGIKSAGLGGVVMILLGIIWRSTSFPFTMFDMWFGRQMTIMTSTSVISSMMLLLGVMFLASGYIALKYLDLKTSPIVSAPTQEQS